MDYLTILGDASDNVPGIKGIGEKGAVKLLTEYLTLDGVYRHLSSIAVGMRKKLEESRGGIELSRTLIELRTDALSDDFDLGAMDFSSINLAAAKDDFLSLDLKKLAISDSAKKNGGEGSTPTEEETEKEEKA